MWSCQKGENAWATEVPQHVGGGGLGGVGNQRFLNPRFVKTRDASMPVLCISLLILI